MSLVLDHKEPLSLRAIAADIAISAALLMAFALDHASQQVHGLYIGTVAFLIIQQDWRRTAYAVACFLVTGFLYHPSGSILPDVVPTTLAGVMAGITTALGISLAGPRCGFRRIIDVTVTLSAATAGALVAAAVEDGILLLTAREADLIAHASQTLINALNGLFVVTVFLMTWMKPAARIHVPSAVMVVALGAVASAFLHVRGLELIMAGVLFAALALGSTRLGVRAATLLSLAVALIIPIAAADLALPLSTQTLALAIAVACFLVGSSIAAKNSTASELDAFLKTQSDLVCSVDDNGRLVHAGTVFRRQLLGGEHADIESSRFDLLCDDPAEATRLLARARRGERVVEVLKMQLSGELRAIRWTILAKNNSDRALLTLHGEDVTETIAAAERSERQNRSYRDVLEAIQDILPCGTFYWPFDENDPTHSDSWHAMLGRPPGGRCSKETWRSLIHPVDLQRVQDETEIAILARIKFHEVYHRMLHADGTWRQVRSIGKVLKDENSIPIAVVGIDFDITALQDAIQKSNRADSAMRGGFDALSLGFAVFDEYFRLVSYNDTLLHHHPALRNQAPLERRSLDDIAAALREHSTGGVAIDEIIKKADGTRHSFVSSIGASLVAIATSLPGGETILIEGPVNS